MSSRRVLLVGTGPMAVEHLRTLRALDVETRVVGRSPEGCARFQESSGQEARPGGLPGSTDLLAWCTHAVVAVDVRSLAAVATEVVAAGVGRVLLEKPGGLDAAAVTRLADRARESSTDVRVAYNRRYYSSTARALEIIAADGGARTVTFDFTEWSDRVLATDHPPEVLANWFLANSSHVVDLALVFAGEPTELSSFVNGSLPWHPAGSHFAGAGRTVDGALLGYRADWSSAGRWSVDITTEARRLVLCPLEELWEQPRNGIELRQVALDDAIDRDFKPGLLRQLESYLDDRSALPTIAEQARRVLTVYDRILTGGSGPFT